MPEWLLLLDIVEDIKYCVTADDYPEALRLLAELKEGILAAA